MPSPAERQGHQEIEGEHADDLARDASRLRRPHVSVTGNDPRLETPEGASDALQRQHVRGLVRKLWSALDERVQQDVWEELSIEETAELLGLLPPLPQEAVDVLAAKARQTIKRGLPNHRSA